MFSFTETSDSLYKFKHTSTNAVFEHPRAKQSLQSISLLRTELIMQLYPNRPLHNYHL